MFKYPPEVRQAYYDKGVGKSEFLRSICPGLAEHLNVSSLISAIADPVIKARADQMVISKQPTHTHNVTQTDLSQVGKVYGEKTKWHKRLPGISMATGYAAGGHMMSG